LGTEPDSGRPDRPDDRPDDEETPPIDLAIDVLHGVHAAEPPSDPA
jgi:hypothetical protein